MVGAMGSTARAAGTVAGTPKIGARAPALAGAARVCPSFGCELLLPVCVPVRRRQEPRRRERHALVVDGLHEDADQLLVTCKLQERRVDLPLAGRLLEAVEVLLLRAAHEVVGREQVLAWVKARALPRFLPLRVPAREPAALVLQQDGVQALELGAEGLHVVLLRRLVPAPLEDAVPVDDRGQKLGDERLLVVGALLRRQRDGARVR
eukprot:CAMPEP_0204586926 /NCGR_PEP_ID=MMETSP0661-20131031/47772_1 /ASSEMBLY_ACC=CAM_ASM_000606 /TAXON_ID=109239 /ORGANISM="Alexandrium margalefi, Strain AMGDE01CS-322" /LENGTH=206 /DNA_ID=CAMNT_0051596607 /DNA_START=242 /DNA_END=858 /DNA_ORIENTATION=-